MGPYILIGVGVILVLLGLFLVMAGIDHLRRKARMLNRQLNELLGPGRLASTSGRMLRLRLLLRRDKVLPVHRPFFIGLILIGGGLYLVLTFITHV